MAAVVKALDAIDQQQLIDAATDGGACSACVRGRSTCKCTYEHHEANACEHRDQH